MDFQIHKSRNYHAKFRAFYLAVNNTVKVASAVSATSAFAFLVSGDPKVATWLSAVVGIASTADLILQFDAKGRTHDALSRKFTDLAAEIVAMEANETNLRIVKARRLLIENDEPTVRRLVDIQARNEELRSRGASEDAMVPLSYVQRTLGYVLTFDMKRLERWKAYREASKSGTTLPPIGERGLIPPFPWSLAPFFLYRIRMRRSGDANTRVGP